MTELIADVNGIKLCYEIHGIKENPPFLLIHGFGSKKTEWLAQVGAFSEYFWVITVDNRGAGKSERPNIPFTMKMFADDIKGLLKHLKIEKTHICGASMGSMIVIKFVLTYPEMVDKLILINSISGFPNEQGLEMYTKATIDGYYKRLEDPVKAYFEGSKLYSTRKFRKLMEENLNTKEKIHGIFTVEQLINNDTIDPARPQDLMNNKNAMAERNFINRLHEINHKTLIIASEKDRLSPVSANVKVHEKVKNSMLKVIKGAAHNSKLAKAPEVNNYIIEFLKN